MRVRVRAKGSRAQSSWKGRAAHGGCAGVDFSLAPEKHGYVWPDWDSNQPWPEGESRGRDMGQEP